MQGVKAKPDKFSPTFVSWFGLSLVRLQVLGGSLSETHAEKMVKVMDMAMVRACRYMRKEEYHKPSTLVLY